MPLDPAQYPHHIFRTYEVVTEESARNGNVSERGYVIPGGWDVPIPEGLGGPEFGVWREAHVRPFDVLDEESPDPVGDTVSFLRDTGCTEPSEYGMGAIPSSWSEPDGYQDPATGDVRTEACHLWGYSADELHAIYERMMGRR